MVELTQKVLRETLVEGAMASETLFSAERMSRPK